MNLYSSVIFDLDGTLSRTNELIFTTFNFVAQKYTGRTYTPVEITAMFGPPEEIAIGKIVGPDRSDAAMDDFLTFYAEHHDAMASTYTGMDVALNALHAAGVRMAVFTGKGKRSAAITLEKLNLSKYFDFVVSGSDVSAHKPSPEGIQLVLKEFGVPSTGVLMVGDAVSDVQAARGAGVQVASVLWDSYAREKVLTMGADYLFHSVADFSIWIRTVVVANGGGNR
jgi:HAD superfamily hydrolase (TIGR01549 family)